MGEEGQSVRGRGWVKFEEEGESGVVAGQREGLIRDSLRMRKAPGHWRLQIHTA
jgi:hypothetical protein